MPDDRVDEASKASYSSPNHVKASTGIPSLQVPGEGNEAHDEAEEDEDGIEFILMRHQEKDGKGKWDEKLVQNFRVRRSQEWK